MTKLYYYELEDYDVDENKNYTTCGLVSGELTEVVSELSEFCGKEFLSMKLVPLRKGRQSSITRKLFINFRKWNIELKRG